MDRTTLHAAISAQREAIADGLSFGDAAQLLASRTRELTGAFAAAVSVLDGGVLVRHALSGPARVPERFDPRGTITGHALESGEPVLCSDAENDERVDVRLAEQVGVRAMIAVPLQRGELKGVLMVFGREAGAFDASDVAAVELLALVVSAALGHAQEVRALARFRAMFDGAAVGIVRIDAVGHAYEANGVAQGLLGYSQAELERMTFGDLIHPDHLDEQLVLHRELMAGRRGHYELEKRYLRKDGTTLWARTRTARVPAVDGEPPSAIAMIQDITERKLADERLARIAETQRDIAAAGLDLRSVMELIAERAMALTVAEGAMVSLLEGDELAVGAAVGVGSPARNTRRRLEDSIASHAFAARDTLLIEHAENDQRLNAAIRAKVGDRSHICVPLFAGDRPVATLNVMTRSADVPRLGEEDRQTLELLAVVLASAVSRAAEFEAKRAQVEALARFEATYSSALAGIMIVGGDGTILDANPAMHDLLGRPAGYLLGRAALEFVHPDDQAVQDEIVRLLRDADGSVRVEHRFVRPDDETVWVETSVSMVHGPDGESFAIAMYQNMTQRKQAEAALRAQAELNQHQALHDALTGLPNRTLFRDRVEQALRARHRSGARLALLMMDLDRFKEINDSLGHAAGDELLVEVARRLDTVVRGSDTVARLGGDEFGLLLPDAAMAADVLAVVERVRSAMHDPIAVQGLPLSIDASIGIAVCPDDGEDAETLLRRADVAMYHAKDENLGYAFYDGQAGAHDPARLTLVGELRRAIEERELTLHYQPQAVLAGGQVRSVEALLRWQHPERGIIPPDEFIPIAQQTGLIKPLTLYVVDEALGQCAAWLDGGLELAVAVNVSARNLLDTEFPAQVRDLLERWSVPPALLVLELTESTMIAEPVRTRAVLEELAEMGIRLSIDDFGTGYSSLAYLKRLPVREIKIDRSFVMSMDTDEDDATIVRSTIELGRNLGLEVVAEGVENQAVLERLRELGCTLAQGYHLSRPVPPAELEDWLQRWHRTPEYPGHLWTGKA